MTHAPVLLCIDAGNTLVKWCVHHGMQSNFPDVAALASCPTSELKPFDTACARLLALLEPVLKNAQAHVTAVLLCNVLGPDFEQAIRRLCEQNRLPLHVLGVNTRVPVQSAYQDPSLLGKDRWAACLAVSQISKAPVNLLVSFGTATTADAVVNLPGWMHLGGFIVPGLRTMLDSLHVNTAELPQLEFDQAVQSIEADFWPVNTRQAIGEGVARMQGAWIQSLVDRLAKHYEQPPVVWFSGGFARQMMFYFPQACLLEHAVFKGLLFDYQCAGQLSS